VKKIKSKKKVLKNRPRSEFAFQLWESKRHRTKENLFGKGGTSLPQRPKRRGNASCEPSTTGPRGQLIPARAVEGEEKKENQPSAKKKKKKGLFNRIPS